uniref:Myosin motor domain-containing protein n=1 Tax=Heterorhabditis bacteriophora TaxID=37862 RepID=A0A1I7XNZ0_HETBA
MDVISIQIAKEVDVDGTKLKGQFRQLDRMKYERCGESRQRSHIVFQALDKKTNLRALACLRLKLAGSCSDPSLYDSLRGFHKL